MHKSSASLCCVYLWAAPIQDTILNLPNPYLRSTSVLLIKPGDSVLHFIKAGDTLSSTELFDSNIPINRQ